MLCSLLVTPSALAAEPPRRETVALEIEVGYGDCSGKLCDGDRGELLGGPGFALAFAYRFLPFVEANLGWQYAGLEMADGSMFGGEPSYSALWLGTRGFLPLGDWDPWVGLSFGTASLVVEDVGDCFDCYYGVFRRDFEATGWTLTPSIGLDYRAGPGVAIGIGAEWTLVSWHELCRGDSESMECYSGSERQVERAWGDYAIDLPDVYAVRGRLAYYF